jgi:hypothetical protein
MPKKGAKMRAKGEFDLFAIARQGLIVFALLGMVFLDPFMHVRVALASAPMAMNQTHTELAHSNFPNSTRVTKLTSAT